MLYLKKIITIFVIHVHKPSFCRNKKVCWSTSLRKHETRPYDKKTAAEWSVSVCSAIR